MIGGKRGGAIRKCAYKCFMYHCILRLKVRGKSRRNTLIKICKRKCLLHSKYTCSFINKVCSIWKKNTAVMVWVIKTVLMSFGLIIFPIYMDLFLYLFKILYRLPSNTFVLLFHIKPFLQRLSFHSRERGKWWHIGWMAEMIWTNSTIAWFANLCQRRKGLEPYWLILAAPWCLNPSRQPLTSIWWRI